MHQANVTHQDEKSENLSTKIFWEFVDWKKTNKIVNNLRKRIFKATESGDYKKVKNLQKLMLKSTANKLISIRRVTQSNKGKYSAGVDGFVAIKNEQRTALIDQLNLESNLDVQPVKRVYIPKANGKQRPLGIPTILDRCMQSVVKNALEPQWESKFEGNSYGFRPGRSCHDAMQKINISLKAGSTRLWVLEADIKGAFDNISHNYLSEKIENFPAKRIIEKWLKAGIVENQSFKMTTKGAPQGSIISPLLSNIALHGLEELLGIKYKPSGKLRESCKYSFVRYADDFVVFARTKEDLVHAKDEIKDWLKERGLELSNEKTAITHVNDGFNFLGFNFKMVKAKSRRKPMKLRTSPSRAAIKEFKTQLNECLRKGYYFSQDTLIKMLNPKIIGWGNYFKKCSKHKAFSEIDCWLFYKLWRMGTRKHSKKSAKWRKDKYWGTTKGRNDKWVYQDKQTGKYLEKISWMPIDTHFLVKGRNSPDNPELKEYWDKRRKRINPMNSKTRRKLWDRQKGICLICNTALDNQESIEMHHIKPISIGGSNHINNLCLLHAPCHYQTHRKKSVVSELLEPYAG